MEASINEIEVNGIKYVKKGTEHILAEELDGMPYVLVRTYSAGVFAGYMQSRDGKESILRNARRLWKWSGAASLSQLAMEGTKRPENCKFPCMVNHITLTESIEILTCTEQARLSIKEVPIWEMT